MTRTSRVLGVFVLSTAFAACAVPEPAPSAGDGTGAGTSMGAGDGTVGDLSNTTRLAPTLIPLGTGETATALASGFIHNCAVTSALNIWCWGYNGVGAIGDGTYNTAFAPVKVTLQ